ncbi:hypothetical protein [Paraliomyxa miuraensis]|uniref:hypothetical protein n=1 Tax=Paraliomyxa miuraensis TaxID=376150 RepID=UPI0022535BDB|nr:hypothetical protein [Paraliomyxa miuraensis]MCX4239812.1 hypothetical protein [Paraliomyxa miuraensis]
MARLSTLARGCLVLCLGGLAFPSLAAANPAVQACEGKREGDACGLMKLVKPPGGGELQRSTVPGVCRADECCDLDYSKGSPPDTVCHACVACKEGPAELTPPPQADGKSPPASNEGEPPRTADGPPPTAPGQQRGCTTGARPSAASGLWGLLMVLACSRRRGASRRVDRTYPQ